MPIWHTIGRTCSGLRDFERGRLRKIRGLPTECVPLRAQPNPTQPSTATPCKECGGITATTPLYSQAAPASTIRAAITQACGNGPSCLEVKGLVTIAQSAHTCPSSPDCVWMRHCTSPPLPAIPDRAGDSDARVSRLPSLKNTLNLPHSLRAPDPSHLLITLKSSP